MTKFHRFFHVARKIALYHYVYIYNIYTSFVHLFSAYSSFRILYIYIYNIVIVYIHIHLYIYIIFFIYKNNILGLKRNVSKAMYNEELVGTTDKGTLAVALASAFLLFEENLMFTRKGLRKRASVSFFR